MTDDIGKAKQDCIAGKHIYLRPLIKEDLSYIRDWVNDPEIRSLPSEVMLMGQAKIEEMCNETCIKNGRLWFSIVLKDDDRLIGKAGLLKMYHVWNTAYLSAFIGDKNEWGKGFGTEVITLLLNHAFANLGLNKIVVGVVEFNAKATVFYQRLGFKKEGLARDGFYYNNNCFDFLMMSILKKEYEKKQGKM